MVWQGGASRRSGYGLSKQVRRLVGEKYELANEMGERIDSGEVREVSKEEADREGTRVGYHVGKTHVALSDITEIDERFKTIYMKQVRTRNTGAHVVIKVRGGKR